MTLTAPLLGARILVAEDDAILAFDILGLLRRAGAEVLGLAEALAFAGSAVLSCAVLDVNLRRELVFPAAHVLKARRVPVIFYTGHGEPEKLRRDWPEAMVLNKPAPEKLLIKAVCEAFRGVGFCASKQDAGTARDLLHR